MTNVRQFPQRLTGLVVTAAVLMAALMLVMPGAVLADDRDEDRGIISQRPEETLVGIWVIDAETYETTDATVFDESNGPLVVDACAQVLYHEDGAANIVDKMRSLMPEQCDRDDERDPNDDDGDDPVDEDPSDEDPSDNEGGDDKDDGDRNRDALRAYGLLISKPEGGAVGSWTIGEEVYIADEETEIDAEHGPFVDNACVKVKYVEVDATKLALELETEHAYKCSGADDDSAPDDGDDGDGDDDDTPARVRGELYGELQAFPQELNGIWRIGGEDFVVNGETELKRENGAFEIGVIVKVHFYEVLEGEQEGVRIATEIKTKVRGDDDGDDDASDDDASDDDDGDSEERDDNSGDGHRHRDAHSSGHAYGLIDSYPKGTPGPIGPWVIGDISYMATERTKFYQVEGLYAEGACVIVRYWRDENAQRIARSIKTDNDACDGDTAEGKLFGFVDEQPAPVDGEKRYVGQWTISGAVLTADEDTMFKETKGLLVEGAYVKVRYTTDGDTNTMVSIETQVPPGAGEHVRRGRVERIDDDVTAATVNAATVTAGQVWVIDGQRYRVSDGTDLDESAGLLGVGALVDVNSYIDQDGAAVATQISSVTLDQTVYLPLVTR